MKKEKNDLIKKIIRWKKQYIEFMIDEFESVYVIAFFSLLLLIGGSLVLILIIILFFQSIIIPIILLIMGIVYFALVKYLKNYGGK